MGSLRRIVFIPPVGFYLNKKRKLMNINAKLIKSKTKIELYQIHTIIIAITKEVLSNADCVIALKLACWTVSTIWISGWAVKLIACIMTTVTCTITA